MAQILIIEDEDLLAKSLARFLSGRKHDCFTSRTAEEGLEMLERMQMDVVLLDLQLPGISGLEAIGRLKKADSDLVIIISTAYGTMAAAVDAMRHGASDFLRKPLDMEEVSLAVDRAITNASIRRKFSYYRDREADQTDADALICNSPQMRTIKEFLERVTAMKLPAASDYPPILILGETGVGKDLIARLAHYHSPLGGEAFIAVNCSALPKGLEEAELFGYEKGAFTGAHRSKRGLFEAAMGGSLFLNEIGDLTAEAQVKLLDVIERKRLRRIGGLRDIPIDVRIIAATNRELKESSSFREDLYFRLNNLTIEVPPLRERNEDLVDLANLFLRQFGTKYGVDKHFAPDAEKALKRYNWPGNVREMRQLIERVTFLSPAAAVHATDLNLPENRPLRVEAKSAEEFEIILPPGGVSFDKLERAVLLKALNECEGNVSQAARRLGMGREALRYRIQKHNITEFK